MLLLSRKRRINLLLLVMVKTLSLATQILIPHNCYGVAAFISTSSPVLTLSSLATATKTKKPIFLSTSKKPMEIILNHYHGVNALHSSFASSYNPYPTNFVGLSIPSSASSPLFMVSSSENNSNNNEQPKTKGIVRKIKNYFQGGDGTDSTETFKEKMAKMGLAAVLSYGWVSNMSYTVSVSLAWYIFSKRTGLSPLAPGQWKGFLAVYAGFFVFNNIVRPIRLGVSVAVAPMFDKVIEKIQQKLNLNKATAVTLTVILFNVFGTTTFMCLGISLAAFISGVPVFAK